MVCASRSASVQFGRVWSGVALAVWLSLPASAGFYKVVDLGTLPGGTSSYAYDVNDAGQVTGYSTSSGGERAFVWDNGVMTSLGVVPGGSASRGYGINAAGDVTGYARVGAYNRAFRYRASTATMTDLGTFTGNNNSIGYDLSDTGTVVGGSNINSSTYNAFTESGSGLTNIGTLDPDPGATNIWGLDINSDGHVVGSIYLPPSYTGSTWETHAFYYDGAEMTDLDTLGGTNSSAYAVNDSGQVTGSASIALGYTHAFRYDRATGMIDLGSLVSISNTSWGEDISADGTVVGWVSLGPVQDRAFVWDPKDGMQNLNGLVQYSPGWTLERAQGINGSGQIVGYGTIGGRTHGFLLVAVPEPGTLLLLGLAGLSLLRRR